MHVIGTAGHVDHGKSSLVRALTGVDPDRLPEERERGMTIDLGFARFVAGDVEGGFVDVPGHERLVHTMLAGAAGMDLLLLVVALDDGAMPQTFEHLAILRHLNVREVIVAATKCDLLDDAARAVALETLRAALHETIAADAPFYSVSTATGEGIETLREAIASALRTLPARDANAPVYLPVDRVFTLPGTGTVVTGTLMQGSLYTGAQVIVAPSNLSAKARSLHVFGSEVAVGVAGSRVAVNLPSLAIDAIARGDVLTDVESAPRDTFDVLFDPETEALPRLKRRTPVRAYIGSAEILGTLVFAAIPATTEPVRARLHLRRPALAFPGTRFIVRGVAQKQLFGGGAIDPGLDGVRGALAAAGLLARSTEQIAHAANLREGDARDALDLLCAGGDALRLSRPEGYLDGTEAAQLLRRVLDALALREAEEPWAMGATALALARALKVPESTMARALVAFAERGDLDARAGYYGTPGFVPEPTPAQRAVFEALPPIALEAPLRPVPWSAVAGHLHDSHVPGAARAFETMLGRGAFVRVGDDCYRGAQIAQIRARVEAHLAEHERMTASAFRDLIGTSRKYAVPLLEWFDARGITVRVGDDRVLRGTGGRTGSG